MLDLQDDHWSEWFTELELQEINAATERQKKHLPQEMKSYLDALPEFDDINVFFNYLNEQQISPSDHRGLYFLKTTLLYSLDLFRISYLPLTDQDHFYLVATGYSHVTVKDGHVIFCKVLYYIIE